MNKIVAFTCAGLALGNVAYAADEDELESGRVIAVQPRQYHLVHEFTVSAGVLPLDAFYTGFSLGGSYTLHLSDLIAWEAVSVHYAAKADTGLEAVLADRWSVAPTGDPQVEYLVGSHVVLSPMFGKFTLFNRSILQGSTYFAAGGGVIRYTDGFRPQLSVGPGLRIFVGQVVSTRLDVRTTFAPDIPAGLDIVLHVTLSVSFNFGSTRATELGEEVEVDNSTGYEALDELYPLSSPDQPKKATEQEEEEK
jgi:outer membrane beta-barrel protein